MSKKASHLLMRCFFYFQNPIRLHLFSINGHNNGRNEQEGREMKKEIAIATGAFFFMTLTAMTYAYAVEDKNKFVVISDNMVDVTGDDRIDKVLIKGIPYEEGTQFLKEIILEIHASNGKTYKEELEEGYEPTVQFVDLNHDQIKDMFISINTGGSGGISNHNLYTLKDFSLTNLGVPEPLMINGQFLNGYKAAITIQDTNQSYTFDLRNRADDYERLGLFQNGKLSEPTELMVDPYSTLKPIKLSSKKLGLLGIQAISGAYHADRIALVESIWEYDAGKWNLKKTRVFESKPPKQKRRK